MRMADTARAMLADALWTGVAIRQYAGSSPVDVRCVHFGGYFVPTMPTNPWKKAPDVLTMLDMLCTTDGNMAMLFEDSKMHFWGVNTIPITPATHNLPADVMTRLRTTPTRMHNFYPKGLLPHNIGSNEGLAKVMRILMQDMGLEPPGAPPTKYTAMLSDINIFDRVIKVTCSFQKQYINIHVSDDVRQEWWRK